METVEKPLHQKASKQDIKEKLSEISSKISQSNEIFLEFKQQSIQYYQTYPPFPVEGNDICDEWFQFRELVAANIIIQDDEGFLKPLAVTKAYKHLKSEPGRYIKYLRAVEADESQDRNLREGFGKLSQWMEEYQSH
jgi:hypothetical protein